MGSTPRRAGGRVAVLVVSAAAALAAAAPAAADVVTPAGACTGSGAWQAGGMAETSTNHQTSDVIEVPRADTVQWSGSQKGYAPGAEGPRRDISGAVRLRLPFGTATIDSWSGSSVRYANEGSHTYDLPSVVAGVKMKLDGVHKENGTVTCSGSVFVKVAGSSPLRPVSLAGLVLSGGVLLWAGKPVFRRTAPPPKDMSEG